MYAQTPFAPPNDAPAHERQGKLFQNILDGDALVHDDALWPGDVDHISRTFATDLLHTQPELRLGRGSNGFEGLRGHAYFASPDSTQFSWRGLEHGSVTPPYVPPAPTDKLSPSNFSPDIDAAAFEETTFTGDQELFAAWSDLDDAEGNYFDPVALHLGARGSYIGDP